MGGRRRCNSQKLKDCELQYEELVKRAALRSAVPHCASGSRRNDRSCERGACKSRPRARAGEANREAAQSCVDLFGGRIRVYAAIWGLAYGSVHGLGGPVHGPQGVQSGCLSLARDGTWRQDTAGRQSLTKQPSQTSLQAAPTWAAIHAGRHRLKL